MPTITNQRIKSITTGNPPSLFDMGENIGSSEEVIEDSIIHQSKASNRTIRMYGDDFWIGLYPKSFDEYEVFPSLDVTDLHSNDKLVKNRLLDQLTNHTDWDILWTHLLGIDHAGHTFNTLGKELDQKIKDVEQILIEVVENLPNNATLAIVSDHGMTSIGSHGGNSEEEINTFIAFYQKDIEFDSPGLFDKLTKVPQTSIAPTLSAIANLNIPFSNIGLVIPSAIAIDKKISSNIRTLERFKIFKQNQIQILNYMK